MVYVRVIGREVVTVLRDFVTVGRDGLLSLPLPFCPLRFLPPYFLGGHLLPVMDGVQDDPTTRHTLDAASFILSFGSERVGSLELLERACRGGGGYSGADSDVGR